MITKDVPKKLFLLDAYALIYRAYFAFSSNPRINSKGLNTSAVFGFTNTLLEVLNKEKPTHIAVAFDLAGPTHRHVEFEDYKANREEMPDDLRKSIPYVFRLLEGFNIPALSVPGYEADDVIGALALQAKGQGFTTYMMTPDKDYGQLVDDNVFIYKPARLGNGAEILGASQICDKWQIQNVIQLIDILGLMGDASDNIPGIPGVGEKTAIQLVKEFHSIENLYTNTEKLKGKLKEKVEQNKEKAFLSKKLATITLDVPITLNEEGLLRKDINKDSLRELLTELEFRALAQKILGEPIASPIEAEASLANRTLFGDKQNTKKTKDAYAQPNLFDSPEKEEGTEVLTENDLPLEKQHETAGTIAHQYRLVDTEEKRKELLHLLLQQTQFCFDSETTSLNTFEAELVGLSFAIKAHEAYYIPFSSNREEAQKIINEFAPLFSDTSKTLIGQNIKYDLQVLKNYGIEIKNKLFDTMIAHFLIQPEMRHGMDVLSETYLNYAPISIETLIGKKGKNQGSMRDVAIDVIKEYAAEDADITLQLQQVFAPKLQENKVEQLFSEVEIPLVPVLADMEYEGVKIDTSMLQEYAHELEKEIVKIDDEIQALAGTPFNVSSPKQVGEVLFDYLRITEKPKKTKTGQYATGEEVLVKLTEKHPIVPKILEYREVMKLKNTYVDTLPQLVYKNSGRVHTSYNQVVAVTGRLSSDNPNLQNIPIRTERGRYIRKAFVPRDDNHVLLSADYSQIELRIVASFSKDEAMCEAFRLGKDIHTATAAKVYGINESEVTKEMRYKAKSVNFGIIYGQGAFGLAENIGVSRAEAKQLIDNYFKEYASIKKYMDDMIHFARENGYVQTLLGRRRWLRDITSANAVVRGFAERNAINAPIQGSAADMIKLAMIQIHKEIKQQGLQSKMILQVHDELIFDVHKDELSVLKPLIENCMKNAMPLEVPVEVGMGVGANWLEAH
ncbi:MAG: DNA polymerase I [Bacteroidetes bacterium]|nr:DNA polymerase I [Bacteroidota bacterium]